MKKPFHTTHYLLLTTYYCILIAIGVFALPLVVFGLSCTQDTDCPAGQVCVNSTCSAKEQITISVTVVGGAPPPAAPSPGGITPPEVIFQGKAYPNAFLTILRNGSTAATLKAGVDGIFQTTVTGLSQGTITFGIFAQDTLGRISPTLNLTLSLINGTVTTISNIFLPPTIDLDVGNRVRQGQIVSISGSIFPLSQVFIFVNSLLEKFISAAENGEWEFRLNTSDLELGTYQVKAKAVSGDGALSIFSETKTFELVGPGVPIEPIPPEEIKACLHGDLNGDGKVDMVDLSILLYWWERVNQCPDQNHDGIVDMIDVSILLFWWTD